MNRRRFFAAMIGAPVAPKLVQAPTQRFCSDWATIMKSYGMVVHQYGRSHRVTKGVSPGEVIYINKLVIGGKLPQ